MILFWLICAGLVAIALAFVLPPLLQGARKDVAEDGEQKANVDVYRDQLSELEADLRNGIISSEQYQQDRDEIERRLLDDVSRADIAAERKTAPAVAGRVPAYAVAFCIPLIAVAMYLLLGNSAALSGAATAPQQAPFAGGSQGNGQMSQQQIGANVAALAKRLEQNPGDAEGWIMLGRSYTSLEKYGDAANAYAKAAALKTNDANVLVDYAFAMAMANGRQLQGQPLEIIKRALQLDPQNPKALELAGTAEFQAKNYKQAIDYWQKLLAKAGSDTELARAVSERINEAKSKEAELSPGTKAK
jgi:cytochrome c-type biogenesis protein CcmH